jgi:hypothetical protein
MEIQKIFSEVDTNEKLYSVLMSEEELALFSEIQKEFGFKEVLQKIAKTPEAKRIISTARTQGNRLAVKTGQALKGITDEQLRAYEQNSGIYADATGKLLKRGAKSVSKVLNKGAKEISNDAAELRGELKRMKTSEFLKS